MVLFLVFIFLTLLACIKNIHMFQLNSYKPKVQLKWYQDNLIKVMSFLVPLALPKAKKALIYTPRIKRLLFTCVVLLIAFGAWSCWAMLAVYIATPLLVLLANLVNAPIEALVRQYYINDAKKMLKNSPDLGVIGITGSYGKTSVKFYLATLLKVKYNTLMTPESYNTTLGVVKTIREQLKAIHEFFVCEMGAKQKNDIKEICDIVKPKYGIITSLGPQHLESFKSLENVVKTKYELIDALPDDGMVFVNGDNEIIRENMPNQKHITYGISPNNNYFAFELKLSRNGTSFKLNTPKGDIYDFQTSLIGEHNVVNLVGALALCDYVGIGLTSLQQQVKKIASVPHRLQLLENSNMLIIDDAYNANPSGTKAALKTLSLFEEYKILITPGMIELGSKQEEYNYEFGQDAAKVCDFIILVGEKQTQPIYKGVIDAKFGKDKIVIAKTVQEAIAKAYEMNVGRKKVALLENDLPDNF